MSKSLESVKEYIATKKRLEAQRAALDDEEREAMMKAQQVPLPEGLRPATPDDIVCGAILWSKNHGPEVHEEGGEVVEVYGSHWVIVEEVRNPQSEFKGFLYDGCRHGWGGYYVVEGDQ